MLRRVLPILLPVIFCGCGHYYLPGHVLDTPEAIGPDGRGRLEAVGVQGGRLLTGKPRQRSPDPETGITPKPTLPYGAGQLLTGLQLALGERFDAGVRFQPYAPLVLRAKYQLAGEPESRSGPGNFSVALLGSSGLLLGSGTTYFTGDAALLAGFRAWLNHLFSVGGLARLGSLNTTIIDTTGSATLYGFCAGYQYTVESLLTRTEITWTNGSFGELDIGGLSLAALVGFRF